jgi:PBP1b-binding outer membrane lipoprotein LpoB
MGTVIMQTILNKHLNGVDINNSNDAILNAMREYADFKVNDIKKHLDQIKSNNYIELRSFAVDFAYYIHITKQGDVSHEKSKQLFDDWFNKNIE